MKRPLMIQPVKDMNRSEAILNVLPSWPTQNERKYFMIIGRRRGGR